MKSRIIEPSFEHRDERGTFKEVAKGSWKAVNFAERKKGSIIGNHYHTHIAETVFLVKGAAHVKLIDINTGNADEFDIKAGACFEIRSYEAHALSIKEDSMLLMLLSEEFDPKNKDLYDFEVLMRE